MRGVVAIMSIGPFALQRSFWLGLGLGGSNLPVGRSIPHNIDTEQKRLSQKIQQTELLHLPDAPGSSESRLSKSQTGDELVGHYAEKSAKLGENFAERWPVA
jgi:hypothetical protein